jgi:preprotein translocase subunit SecY
MTGTKAYSLGMFLHYFITLLLFYFFLILYFFIFLFVLFFISLVSLPGCLPHLESEKKQIKGLRPGERVDQLHRTISAFTYSTTRARSTERI